MVTLSRHIVHLLLPLSVGQNRTFVLYLIIILYIGKYTTCLHTQLFIVLDRLLSTLMIFPVEFHLQTRTGVFKYTL